MAGLTWQQRLALRYFKTRFRVWTAISRRKAAEKAFALFCTPQRRLKNPLSELFLKAERLHLTVEGLVCTGWRWNKGGSRRVLLVHGFESSVTNFERYVQPLLNKGYEVLAFDAPAHGRSEGKMINAPLYKKTIETIHKTYGPVESYLAHSFGGLAVCLALEEISHTADYRVVLIAPATETGTAIDSFFKFLSIDDRVRPEFERLIVKRSGVSSDWFSIRRAMKHIRARVLWFHDRHDETTPVADAEKVMAANFSNIRFVFTEGLGHRKIYRDQQVCKAAVDFL